MSSQPKRNVAKEYAAPVMQLFELGEANRGESWFNYPALGLTESHAAELIRIATDEDLLWAKSDSDEVWAPLHAWRALGQLRCESAIHGLIGLFRFSDEKMDDWMPYDLPRVLGMIGPAAIFPLRSFLIDDWHGPYARNAAAESLTQIANRHPQCREECVAILVQQLEQFESNHKDLNGFLIAELIELQAMSGVSVIKKAFESGRVPEMICGDWEDVQIEFGLLEERITPRPLPEFVKAIQARPQPKRGTRTARNRQKRKRK